MNYITSKNDVFGQINVFEDVEMVLMQLFEIEAAKFFKVILYLW